MRAHKALFHNFQFRYSEGYCSTYHTMLIPIIFSLFQRNFDQLFLTILNRGPQRLKKTQQDPLSANRMPTYHSIFIFYNYRRISLIADTRNVNNSYQRTKIASITIFDDVFDDFFMTKSGGVMESRHPVMISLQEIGASTEQILQLGQISAL